MIRAITSSAAIMHRCFLSPSTIRSTLKPLSFVRLNSPIICTLPHRRCLHGVTGRTFCHPALMRKDTSSTESSAPVKDWLNPAKSAFWFPVDEVVPEFSVPFRESNDLQLTKEQLEIHQEEVETEVHQIELEMNLQGKCAKANDLDSTEQFRTLCRQVTLLSAKITRLENGMSMEKIEKDFVIWTPYYQPSLDAPLTNTPIHKFDYFPSNTVAFGVHIVWTHQRHAVRKELAPYEFYLKVVLTPVIKEEASDELEFKSDESLQVLEANECDDLQSKYADSDLWTDFQQFVCGPNVKMTSKQFNWFIAFLLTHPSDYAFDIVSRLLPLDYTELEAESQRVK